MIRFGYFQLRILLIALCLLGFASHGHAQKPAAHDIIGFWEAQDKTLKLEMFATGNEFDAHLLWGNRVVESDGLTFKPDSKNPDAALRNRSLKGIVFVKGLSWDDGKWSGGTLYDGSSGRTYKCKAEIKDGKLNLRGYLGTSMLGNTIVLVRVQDSSNKP